jgi:hypothetical protein
MTYEEKKEYQRIKRLIINLDRLSIFLEKPNKGRAGNNKHELSTLKRVVLQAKGMIEGFMEGSKNG